MNKNKSPDDKISTGISSDAGVTEFGCIEPDGPGEHHLPDPACAGMNNPQLKGSNFLHGVHASNDASLLQPGVIPRSTYIHALGSLDELLERDKRREEDGFPRKIRLGKLVKPGKGSKSKVIIVPTTVEEKFIHAPDRDESGNGGSTGGAGDGDEGEVIGEQPVHGTEGSGTGGAGQGDSGEHEIESSAYDLGKILTDKFQLPNLKDKGRKQSLTRYTYDLTDRHNKTGQILDKKATLRKVVETNINLANIPDVMNIDPAELLFTPGDKVYRILSREKGYDSQAMIFFVRDYSGSMTGKPTELVVSQHVLLYSWLLYQYEKQVETRFILHDTEAKEVPDFYTYYNSSVAGGTRIESAYRLVNEIVENENLERDYNIYVFHGTDGDDWDALGKSAVPELRKMVLYSNRIGITIAQSSYARGGKTAVERYMGESGILRQYPDQIRMDTLSENAPEDRIIEGMKKLLS